MENIFLNIEEQQNEYQIPYNNDKILSEKGSIVDSILRISISTQLGCNVGCNFCNFGKSFSRNLTFEEMRDQIISTIEIVDSTDQKYSSVIVDTCGSGEPVLNWKNVEKVIEYCKLLDYSFNLYTVGIDYPDIYNRCLNLAIRYPKFNLYFNIISLSDKERTMSISNHNLYYFRLEKIVNFSNKYKHNSGKKVYIIYHITGNETSSDIELLKKRFNQTTLDIRVLHDNGEIVNKLLDIENFRKNKLEDIIDVKYPNDIDTKYELQYYILDGKI